MRVKHTICSFSFFFVPRIPLKTLHRSLSLSGMQWDTPKGVRIIHIMHTCNHWKIPWNNGLPNFLVVHAQQIYQNTALTKRTSAVLTASWEGTGFVPMAELPDSDEEDEVEDGEKGLGVGRKK